MLLCATDAAAASWVLDVPLTGGGPAAKSFVQSHGGSVQGGSFSAAGWTTTTRGDFIEIPLPPGIDARHGALTVTVDNPELSGPKGFFESYMLASLDTTGAPFAPTKAGKPGLQALYIAYNELDETFAQARGYFNLGDPSCTDWKLCTIEGSTKKGWLSGTGPFTLDHAWDGSVDVISFTPGGGNKTLDLTATAPNGSISAPQLILTLNPCGGSKSNACGLWDGSVHGGPLGVTYSKLRLELLTAADAGSGGAAGSGGSPPDAGSGGATGSGGGAGSGGTTTDGGATGSGGADAGSATGGVGASPSSGSTSTGDDGGCGCRTSPRRSSAALFAFAAALLLLHRRRRA